MDKISVIIPVYKVEKVLDECVNSVVGQSYTELEIILVDDGSPDSCPRKCDEWAERDGRVKVIHQENRGLSGARNSGLEVMTGKYVTFVDSDDALHPEAIRILYDALIGDGSDMSVGRFKVFSEHPEAEEISDGERESRVLDRVSYMNGGRIMNRPEAWGKLYKTELFASSVNFLVFSPIDKPTRLLAKIRYRHKPAPATVSLTEDGRLHVIFDEPQRAICKGQSLVLYDGDTVVGGGIID
jgi:glycosyltransferase involved in cell wall biosynthesis